jgi:very-short-patch-repair endonuclease
VDAVVGALADRQQGCVARRQLIARGITADQITRRIRDGRLRPIHRGVYLVGHAVLPPHAKEAAAILVYEGPAFISHRSSARLHRILPWPRNGDVSVTTPHGRSRKGLIVSNARLDARDITRVHRIPTTTAARAILECAAILPLDEDDRLEQMCAEAHAFSLAKLPDLEDQIKRNPGKRGVARLSALLRRHQPARTKLELERRLLRLVRSSDLPAPEVNAFVEGKERDMVWRAQKLVVEADSYAFHSHSRAWARDIGNSNELQLRGFIVLRFTWFDVTERPSWVIEEIRRAIGVRRAA